MGSTGSGVWYNTLAYSIRLNTPRPGGLRSDELKESLNVVMKPCAIEVCGPP